MYDSYVGGLSKVEMVYTRRHFLDVLHSMLGLYLSLHVCMLILS